MHKYTQETATEQNESVEVERTRNDTYRDIVGNGGQRCVLCRNVDEHRGERGDEREEPAVRRIYEREKSLGCSYGIGTVDFDCEVGIRQLCKTGLEYGGAEKVLRTCEGEGENGVGWDEGRGRHYGFVGEESNVDGISVLQRERERQTEREREELEGERGRERERRERKQYEIETSRERERETSEG